MKLYEVPNRTWIKVYGEKIYFDHIDGAYSFCQDEGGNVVHIAASAEVELIEEKTKMSINEITIGQAKELIALFGQQSTTDQPNGLNAMVGKKCIIRTYSAGVWFGTVEQKAGNEVIIINARRMWQWWAKESISLSAVAVYGIKQDKSKIAPKVDSVWLEAIELIPCTDVAVNSIESAKDVAAE
jgi:hypothetical protein